MKTIQEMNNWTYKKAWQFFTENAVNNYIPEAPLYVEGLEKMSKTIDVRDDKNARSKILKSIKNKKTLVLIDGSSLNGKSTFARRIVNNLNGAEIVDIDLICKDYMDQHLQQLKNPLERYYFLSQADKLTDIYILDNLEKMIKEKSSNTVILVGCYLEVMYRAIISKTLGKYFEQIVSIYCCAKTFKEVEMLIKERDKEFGKEDKELEIQIYIDYEYSKQLLADGGSMLGIGMDASFIADTSVSNMFV